MSWIAFVLMIGLNVYATPLATLAVQKQLSLPACTDCQSGGWRSSRDGEFLSAIDGQSHLRVVIVQKATASEAQKYVNMQSVILNASYRSIPSPYIAMISRTVKCSKEFRPIVKGQGADRFLLTAVSARLAFGVCEKAEAKYWSGIRFYFDPDLKRVLKIERYEPFSTKGRGQLDKYMGELKAAMKDYKLLLPGRTKT